MLVIADLKVNIQKKYLKQRITYRNTKNIDLDKFKLDIQKSDLITVRNIQLPNYTINFTKH